MTIIEKNKRTNNSFIANVSGFEQYAEENKLLLTEVIKFCIIMVEG